MKEVKKLQELIDREQAGKNICKYCASNVYCKEDDCMVYQGLRDTPTIQIEAEPVRHGRWENGECTNCKRNLLELCGGEDYELARYAEFDADFCPFCGAKMDDYVADVSKKVGIADGK